MAQFPTREADVMALAQNLVSGLTDNVATYPAPPVAVADLQAQLTSFIDLCDQAVAARAAAEQMTETKRAGLDELVDSMRANLRYAEDVVDYDDAQLSLLGWAGRAEAAALQPPGQARNLEVVRQGTDWVFIDWKAPAEGGKVASYKIERRERPTGDWMLINMAFDSELTLTGQDRTKEWEYRVIATNKAGDGVPSNTAARMVS